MNDNSLNDRSLSRLYRLFTAKRTTAVEVDAEELATAVSGNADASNREAVASKLAISPRHADLARMLHALQPASAELAESVRRRGSLHPQRGRDARPSHVPRRASHRPLRWVGGLAACLALTLGVVGVWHGKTGESYHRNVVAAVTTAPDRIFTSQDRIFASNDNHEHHQKSTRDGDKLFHGDFSG